RVAITAAAAGAEDQPVLGPDRETGDRAHVHLGSVGAPHPCGVGGAIGAAEQAPGRHDRALDLGVEHDLVFDAADDDLHAQPAASLAAAAAVLPQAAGLDDQRVIGLLHFDRRGLHVALADRHAGAVAVAVGPPAPAAAEDVEG